RFDLRRGSDFAPYKPHVDVTLSGHAYPPPGTEAVPATQVEMVVGSLTARLTAVGDRHWAASGKPSPPTPFSRLPLTWSRAFGGPEHGVNPYGRGYGSSSGVLPNLERIEEPIHSRGAEPTPVCFAPLHRAGPLRAQYLDNQYGPDWVAHRWPYLPDDFDWRYFQHALPALQLRELRGDERFALSGVAADRETIVGRLPAQAVFAYAVARDTGALTPIELKLDTLHFEPDAACFSLTWRGSLRVTDEPAPEIERLFVVAASHGPPLSVAEVEAKLIAAAALTYGAGVVVPVDAEGSADAAAARPPGGDERAPPTGRATSALPPGVRPARSREEVRSMIAAGGSLVGVDCTGCDLQGLDLRGRDLRSANLSYADLDAADLSGANLSGALMVEVYAPRAQLDAADLTSVNLAGAYLVEATLRRAKLTGASLADSDATGATFDEAELGFASVTDARLRGASLADVHAAAVVFSGADLTDASLRRATLVDAQLYDARAEGAVFDDAELTQLRADDAALSRASFSRVRAVGCSFQRAQLVDTTFEEAEVSEGVFTRANLGGAKLVRVRARKARFRRADLSRASLVGADLMEANLEAADLTGCDLRHANLHDAETLKARLSQVRLDGALVSGSKLARRDPV
ncbi:MAG: DUF2169 domain-containing protein, partial [Myxococcota bacterium]